MTSAPSTKSERTGEDVRLALTGDWTVEFGPNRPRAQAESLVAGRQRRAARDDRSRRRRASRHRRRLAHRPFAGETGGGRRRGRLFAGASPNTRSCCDEAHYRVFDGAARRTHPPHRRAPQRHRRERLHGRDATSSTASAFLAGSSPMTVWLAVHPARWRVTSIVFHFESVRLAQRADHRADQFPGRRASSRSRACSSCSASARRPSPSI